MSDSNQRPGIAPEFRHVLRLDRLRRDAPCEFSIAPDGDKRTAIAAELGLLGLRKMRFQGHLSPLGRDGWSLYGTLGATVDQPCVATLAPVRTRIDVPVARTYVANAAELAVSEEVEITADTPDEVEPLTAEVDLGALAVGELALALPTYPRALDAPVPTPDPGAEEQDETHRPFAGLAALREKLQQEDDDS